MTDARIAFENELETFRKEVETAGQLLYAHLTVHNTAVGSRRIQDAIRRHPYFWSTTLHALQCAGFVTLGRVFDQHSPHNVDSVLRLASRHAFLFSKEELAKRKRENNVYMDSYFASVYVPTAADFRKLRKEVAVRRGVYQQMCDRIRDGIFAHCQVSDPQAAAALFSKVEVCKFQKLIVFLSGLHEALLQLYNNGRRPVLRPMPYSARRMIRARLQAGQPHTIHQVIVKDTQAFLKALQK